MALAEFEEFVEARQEALLRAAYLLTQDRAHAEDLLQEVLIKVYRQWRRRGWPAQPTAYVRRALVNEYVSIRRRRWWGEVPVAPAELSMSPAPTGNTDERLMVWRALGTLAPRQRAVLVLRLYEGLSDAEIGEYLGCAEGTVRSLAARAYQTLRENCELLDRLSREGESNRELR